MENVIKAKSQTTTTTATAARELQPKILSRAGVKEKKVD
jgi:hypothetical protein